MVPNSPEYKRYYMAHRCGTWWIFNDGAYDNVLYSWLEVEYGLCELKDVLQPEQYGKKCGFPVVDYAGK